MFITSLHALFGDQSQSSQRETNPWKTLPLPEGKPSDFFKIISIKTFQRQPPADAVYLQTSPKGFKWRERVFTPYFEVSVQTSLQYESKKTFARLHIYDKHRKLVETLAMPSMTWRTETTRYAVPVFYGSQKREAIYFPIPSYFASLQGSVIAVFGDDKGIAAKVHPAVVSTTSFDFPERDLVFKQAVGATSRDASEDPVFETVVQTFNAKQPQITLFIRKPLGSRSLKESKGVLAICLSANNALDIKTKLQNMDRGEDERIFADLNRVRIALRPKLSEKSADEIDLRFSKRKPEDDGKLIYDLRMLLKGVAILPEDATLRFYAGFADSIPLRIYLNNLAKFADQHELAILAWGSRQLWDPKLSYEELSRQANREFDDSFDQVADAWEKGVEKLAKQYGFPNSGFIMTARSSAAQYACRLALRKPDRFLAIHAHIPSSFDKPTVEGNKVLWLLTTGEKEGGYSSAKQFFNVCKNMGYPMLFKAIPALGHSDSWAADRLGLEFFEYAISMQSERTRIVGMNKVATASMTKPEPWPQQFRRPMAIGDILNQDIFTKEEASFIPEEQKVAIPTKEIAEAWLR